MHRTRHSPLEDSTQELPPATARDLSAALTEDTPVKLKASTIFTVGAAVCSIVSVIIAFTIWLNTMHQDVAQLKVDVHELRVWLMPEHHPNENPRDHRISEAAQVPAP